MLRKLFMSASAESGKIFEYRFQQYLLSKGIQCQTPELLVKSKSIDSVCTTLLDRVFNHFSILGKAKSFHIYKDSQGEANNGGHSADIHIEFEDGQIVNHCYISLKHNNKEIKAQRPQNLLSQLGSTRNCEEFKKDFQSTLTRVCERFAHVHIFSELNEYDKLQVFRTINQFIALKIREFAKSQDDHSRYLNFLRGGDTQWVLFNKGKTMLMYKLPVFDKDVKIAKVDEMGSSLFIILTNGCIFRLRLHNDDRPFNTNMKLKYSTTLIDVMKACTEIYEVSMDGIAKKQQIFTDKERDAILKEQKRRQKMNSQIESDVSELCKGIKNL